jgi:hypothetical protein
MPDSQGPRWGGRRWSEWCSLDEATVARVALAPVDPGIYRLRCAGEPGLIYIGQSGSSLRGRLRQLVRGIRNVSAPNQHVPHFAAPCVRQHIDRSLTIEVSWIVLPPNQVDKRERFGIECDLMAAYRRSGGMSPTCQFSGELDAP